MAKWGEIKCPRCAELKDKLNYAVGEREDYEKIIKQLQDEWLVNRVAIMRLEAKLAKVIILAGEMAEAIEDRIDICDASMDETAAVKNYRATLAELTGGNDE